MKKIFLIILSIVPILLQAQIRFQKELTHPSKQYLSSLIDLIQNSDSTYTGVSLSVFENGKGEKLRILKLDKYGNIIWQREYKAKGYDTTPYKIVKDKNSFYIMGEYVIRDSVLVTVKSFMMKINDRGDSLWLKDYKLPPIWSFLYGFLKLSDNNILLYGHTTSFKKVGTDYKEQPWNIALVKIDSLGNMIWQKELAEYKNALALTSNAIAELPNKDFLIAGRSVSYVAGENHDIAPIVLRIDKDGNLKWLKRYGELGINDAFGKITKNIDNTFILSGAFSTPFSNAVTGGIIAKMNEQGEILWYKKYQGEAYNLSLYGGHIVDDKNGDVTASGVNIKNSDIGIVQFDSMGNVKWFRKYDIALKSNEIMNGIISTLDGGFAFYGHGKSTIRQNDQPFLFKVDGYGCLVKGCEGSVAVDDTPQESEAFSFGIAPNPNNGIATISWNIAAETAINARVEVIDVLGQVIQVVDIQQLEGKQSLDISAAAAGLNFLKLKIKDKEFVRKFIVIK